MDRSNTQNKKIVIDLDEVGYRSCKVSVKYAIHDNEEDKNLYLERIMT